MEPSRFEMVVKSQDRTYFVHGGPRGLVFGPSTRGIDDHVTVGLDDGEFSEAHRKVNGHEEWRMTPELFQAEVDAFVANNVKPIEFASLTKPGMNIVSINRLRVLSAIPQALVSLAMPFAWRLIATKETVRTASGQEVKVTLEQRKVRHLIAKSGFMGSVLVNLLKHLPPKVPVKVLELVGRFVTVSPQTSDRLEDDLFFVLSEDRVGLVWSSESGVLQYLPIAPLLDLFGRAERNLPFGKLSELDDGWTGEVSFVGRSW
jgi:hypothetical protein